MSFEPRSVTVLAGQPAWATHAPHPSLARHVSSYWSVRFAGKSHRLRGLPDACTDVAFDLASPEPKAYVTGPQKSARTFHLRGRVALLGVRLQPGAAPLLLGKPVTARHLWLPLSRWLGEAALPLQRAVHGAADDAARLGLIEAFLLQRLAARSVDDRLSNAIALAFESGGQATVRELARAAACSERNLGRLFESGAGLSPKRFCRVVRFQEVLRRLDAAPDWAALAAELGYSDQAHLVREVRALFGATPSQVLGLAPATR